MTDKLAGKYCQCQFITKVRDLNKCPLQIIIFVKSSASQRNGISKMKITWVTNISVYLYLRKTF